MRKRVVDKKDLKNILLPFTLNGKRIYSKSTLGNEGFFGFDDLGVYFIPIDNQTQDKVTLEVPETIEEMHKYVSDVDYFIQRVSMNQDIPIEGMNSVPAKEVLEHLIKFAKTFEENLHNIERIKNGYRN